MKKSSRALELQKIRQAARRIQEIWAIQASTPPAPLKKKIFAGHWRFLKVREDVLRCSDGEQASKVVAACNTWCLGKKKDPSSFRISTEVLANPSASPHRRFSHWESGQGLRPLGERAYADAGFPDFFARKWFLVQEETVSAGTKTFSRLRYFPQVPRHMLEYGYKPGYITEAKPLRPDLESELTRLYDFMNRRDGWAKIGQSRNRDEWDLSLERKKATRKLQEREIRSALSEIRQ